MSRIETGHVMRIGEVRQAMASPAGSSGGAAPVPESRALVALAPAAKTQPAPSSFRPAPFIAHLLAVKDQHAQTRERRRAEPFEAITAYRAAAALSR